MEIEIMYTAITLIIVIIATITAYRKIFLKSDNKCSACSCANCHLENYQPSNQACKTQNAD